MCERCVLLAETNNIKAETLERLANTASALHHINEHDAQKVVVDHIKALVAPAPEPKTSGGTASLTTLDLAKQLLERIPSGQGYLALALAGLVRRLQAAAEGRTNEAQASPEKAKPAGEPSFVEELAASLGVNPANVFIVRAPMQ